MKACLYCKLEFAPKRKEQIYCSKSCAAHYKGANKRGKKLPPRVEWKYSARTQDKNGYVRMYAGNHLFSKGRKMIAAHIMVIEAHIGRALTENECVHHINENKQDNRLGNLQLMTKAQHSKLHATETARQRNRNPGGTFA